MCSVRDRRQIMCYLVEIPADSSAIVVANGKFKRRRLRFARTGMMKRVGRGHEPRSSKESGRSRETKPN